MNRLGRWILAGCVGALTVMPVLAARPNVLFLLSDDQQHNAIRALGNRDVQTPNLDRLVENGFTFTHAFCMGSTEPAVCAPSRAMILSGRTLYRAVGTNQNTSLQGIPLWPQTMRRAGYTTAGIGKWHNGRASFTRCFDAGGPVFFGGMNDQTRMPVHDFDPEGRYGTNQLRIANGFATTVFADAAVQFLQGYSSTNPFFLYVAFTAPHDPRMAPAAFKRLYEPASLALPRNFLPEHPFNNGEMLVRDERLAPWPRTPEVLRQHLADYYASISLLDAEVGRILGALKARGWEKETLIVYASDHGLALGQHGLMGKQNLYDHSLRAPLVFSGPGLPRGKQSDALCYLLDIFPTTAELTGTTMPDGVEGRSLAPIMMGRASKVRDAVFGAYRDVQRMVRDERWKLIRYPKVNKTQLFDLRNDPYELNDLGENAAQRTRVRRMTASLEKLQREIGDRVPLVMTNLQPLHIDLKSAADGPAQANTAAAARTNRTPVQPAAKAAP